MILVTGATGFLGAEVCIQLLASGKRVRATRRHNSKLPDLLKEQPGIDWVIAPLEDTGLLEDALEGVTTIYHCAALVSFDPADRGKLFDINIFCTATLVNLCLEKGIRLIHVSSVAALGDARKGMLINEQDYPDAGHTTHAYGISKYEGEMEVWRGIAEGLDAVIVNPSVILGTSAGFSGSGAMFKLVLDGLKFYTSGASGFVDVSDVASAMILLGDSNISGERYIVSSGNYHFKDLFSEMATGLGVTPPAIEARPWMLSLAWRGAKLASLFSRKAPALTRETAKSSFNVSYYDNQKIKDSIGISFKPVAETIAEITSYLKPL